MCFVLRLELTMPLFLWYETFLETGPPVGGFSFHSHKFSRTCTGNVVEGRRTMHAIHPHPKSCTLGSLRLMSYVLLLLSLHICVHVFHQVDVCIYGVSQVWNPRSLAMTTGDVNFWESPCIQPIGRGHLV